jgi:hypothetical protein
LKHIAHADGQRPPAATGHRRRPAATGRRLNPPLILLARRRVSLIDETRPDHPFYRPVQIRRIHANPPITGPLDLLHDPIPVPRLLHERQQDLEIIGMKRQKASRIRHCEFR